MIGIRVRLIFPLILGLVTLLSQEAMADFIGDEVTARAYFPEFAVDVTGSAVVASPGLEFDDFGAGSAFNGANFDIDVEGASIVITVNGFFGIATFPSDAF